MDNFNYPMGADNSLAPWNQKDNFTAEFDVYVIQTLTKATTVHTDDYIEGEVEWESESDEDGNRVTVSVPGTPDTSDTDWNAAFDNEHCSAWKLIQELRRTKEKYIEQYEAAFKETDSDLEKARLQKLIREAKYWVEECKGWEVESLEIEEN